MLLPKVIPMRHSKDYKERLFVSSERSLTLASQLLVSIVSETTEVVVFSYVSEDRWAATSPLDEEHAKSSCV